MEQDGVRGEALHISKDLSVHGWCHRIMAHFLVSCFCDWIWKPGTEQHRRGKGVKARQCHTNQNSITKDCSGDKGIAENQGGLSERGGGMSSPPRLAICFKTQEGTKTSRRFAYNTSTCRRGCDFRFKYCVSNEGANLNVADKQAAVTGRNLHFILVILFSTNKLTPEKT